MSKQFNIGFNQSGNLYIYGYKSNGAGQDLFGSSGYEFNICIESHHLRSLRSLFQEIFDAIELPTRRTLIEFIKKEFFQNRRLGTLRNFLDNNNFPYRLETNIIKMSA